MAEITGRTMLYRAMRRRDGRHVVIDPQHLSETTMVVDNDAEYSLAHSLGWCRSPQEALAQLQAEEDALSTDAAIRAHDDLGMSESALAEAEAFETATIRHQPEIPDASKRRLH